MPRHAAPVIRTGPAPRCELFLDPTEYIEATSGRLRVGLYCAKAMALDAYQVLRQMVDATDDLIATASMG